MAYRRTLNGLFCVAATLIASQVAYCQDTQPDYAAIRLAVKQSWFRPTLEFRADVNKSVGGSSSGLVLGPLPLSIRQIPHHPDDPNYTFVIPGQYMNGSVKTAQFGLSGGAVLWNRIAFRGGPLWPTYAGLAGDSLFQEINQFGAPTRGYGTSLVYVQGKASGTGYFGYFGETEVRIVQPKNYYAVGLVGGYTESKFDVNVQRGYDRNDALSKLDAKYFSNNFARQPYFGVSFGGSRYIEPITARLYILACPMAIHIAPMPEFGLPVSSQKIWTVKVTVALGWIRTKMPN